MVFDAQPFRVVPAEEGLASAIELQVAVLQEWEASTEEPEHMLGMAQQTLIAADIDAIKRQNSWRIAMAIQNYADNGAFAPRKIVDALRTTSDELARSLGLGKDAIQRKDRIASDRTQRRLRQMVEVLNKVEPRFGSALLAYAWYRSEPLPGFSGQTAMQLVQNNRADDVLTYIDAVDAGIHA